MFSEVHFKRIRGGADIRRVQVAVIGAGPAGLSAAIQLQKENISCLVLERRRVGGILWYANRVDNILGLKGTPGWKLCDRFHSHTEKMGVEIRYEEATSIKIEETGFEIKTSDSKYFSDYLILATGSVPHDCGIEGSMNFIEDPSGLEGKDLLIVGGGDLAFDNALRASGQCRRVSILYRSKPRANQSLIREVDDAGIELIKGDTGMITVEGGYYFLNGTVRYDMVACFIGRSPERSLISGLSSLKIDPLSHESSVNRLYVIGDAASVKFSQTARAMSSGLVSAMDISRRMKTDESGSRNRK